MESQQCDFDRSLHEFVKVKLNRNIDAKILYLNYGKIGNKLKIEININLYKQYTAGDMAPSNPFKTKSRTLDMEL